MRQVKWLGTNLKMLAINCLLPMFVELRDLNDIVHFIFIASFMLTGLGGAGKGNVVC